VKRSSDDKFQNLGAVRNRVAVSVKRLILDDFKKAAVPVEQQQSEDRHSANLNTENIRDILNNVPVLGPPVWQYIRYDNRCR